VIVNNILKNRRHFDRDGNLLIIRYNLDHENRDAMPEFMRLVKGFRIRNLSFMVVNVVNYDFNPYYRNNLSELDYFDQCGVALDEMVNLEIPVRVIPYGVITPCHVFTPYSCKVFYDGRLNGCDISDQPGQGSIFEQPSEVFFRGRETMNALTHKLCMGDYKICNLQVFPLQPYLSSYLKAVRTGRERLFENFVTYANEMRKNVSALLADAGSEFIDAGLGKARSPFVILNA
jgi:hypothetical protein